MTTEIAVERAAAMRVAAVGDIAGALGIHRQVAEASGDPEDRLFLGHGRELRLALCTSTAWRNRRPVAANLPRAIRLVEREDPCVEKGYAVVGAMGASVASAEELELSARLALELVHQFQDATSNVRRLVTQAWHSCRGAAFKTV